MCNKNYTVRLKQKVLHLKEKHFFSCTYIYHQAHISHPIRGQQLPSQQSPQLLTEGPGFEARLAKTAMYANGTWCMSNPSWVQCPPCSHPNYTSGDAKAAEPSPPYRFKIAVACLRMILSPCSPMLNPANQQTMIN